MAEGGNGLRLTFEWVRGVWLGMLVLSGFIYYVYEARGDIDRNTEMNLEQQSTLDRLVELHEKEDQRMEAQREQMRMLCRQGHLDADFCLTKGVFP